MVLDALYSYSTELLKLPKPLPSPPSPRFRGNTGKVVLHNLMLILQTQLTENTHPNLSQTATEHLFHML